MHMQESHTTSRYDLYDSKRVTASLGHTARTMSRYLSAWATRTMRFGAG